MSTSTLRKKSNQANDSRRWGRRKSTENWPSGRREDGESWGGGERRRLCQPLSHANSNFNVSQMASQFIHNYASGALGDFSTFRRNSRNLLLIRSQDVGASVLCFAFYVFCLNVAAFMLLFVVLLHICWWWWLGKQRCRIWCGQAISCFSRNLSGANCKGWGGDLMGWVGNPGIGLSHCIIKLCCFVLKLPNYSYNY